MQCQHKEEEEKWQQDEEAAQRMDDTQTLSTTNPQLSMEDAILNFSNEVHSIMNGVQDMESDDAALEDKDDMHSPIKTHQGSSKTSSQWNATARQVSPTKSGTTVQSSTWSTSFLDTFVYPHSCIILELAVLLKSNKAFKEFTQALMAFLTNAQMVNPKFAINPLNPNLKEMNILSNCEISNNMTKLGSHIKISGNGNVFNKQMVWHKEGNEGRKTCKASKKEDFKDPTVYFSMIIV